MPYISPGDRPEIDKALNELPAAMSPGEVAYAITRIVMNHSTLDPESYGGLAQIIGVMETVKLEFQERLVAPYEALKAKLNGDAF